MGRITRCAFFIDGQNFHHLLEGYNGLDSYHLDWKKLLTFFATPKQGSSEQKEIAFANYYMAIFPVDVDEYKNQRDITLQAKLKKDYNIKVCLGQFKKQQINTHSEKMILVEKGVDVAIATDVYDGAVFDDYDVAYVLSEDTDILPAIRKIKYRNLKKKIFQVCFKKLAESNSVYDACLTFHKGYIDQWMNTLPPTSQDMNRLVDKFKRK